MKFKIQAKGHSNITSRHKSTFEITKNPDLSLAGDCIIGVAIDKSMKDFSNDFKKKIANEDTRITIKLKTKNSFDEINGHGHPNLTLNHPTDIVCRKSSFICSKTLMINSNKASCDLNLDLISDLKKGHTLDFEIYID
ncbi:MAG: DUF371 domain-containing protein [Methanobacteriaceae archaeon]|jgi:hypothetical protein|nr:DUF371 domain-containing protein [Candidatus Methanorudis spinitermitis]